MLILPVQIWSRGEEWRLLWRSVEVRVYHVTELVYMSVEINFKNDLKKKRWNHSIILQIAKLRGFNVGMQTHLLNVTINWPRFVMFVCHSTRFTLGHRSERRNAAVLSHLFTNTSLTASTGNELLVQSLISRTEFPLRAHECRPQSLHERAIELLRSSAQVF